MKFDFQTLACGMLLVAAIVYVFRTVRKSFKHEHDCPDCGVAVDKKKVKSHSFSPKK
jgi:hypothetical protein